MCLSAIKRNINILKRIRLKIWLSAVHAPLSLKMMRNALLSGNRQAGAATWMFLWVVLALSSVAFGITLNECGPLYTTNKAQCDKRKADW